jgi:5,10-methylenetetrahydromethanopterin reductase
VRFAREFCPFGTAGQIAERLTALHDAGVSGAFLQHVGSYDPPTELIEAVGSAVLPEIS